MTDQLTILRTSSRKYRACKTARWNGGSWSTESYDAGYKFYVEQRPVSNIHDLHRELQRLANDQRRFVIRGAPLDPAAQLVQRTYRRKPNQEPNFKGHDRHWLLFDLDCDPAPYTPDWSDPTAGERFALFAIREYLPPAFWGVSFHWQLTGSSGTKTGKVGMRLGFWLDRPVCDVSLRRWVGGLQAHGAPLDPALYNPVQPHYTANPMIVGAADPVARRCGFWQGPRDTVTAPRGLYDSAELLRRKAEVKARQEAEQQQWEAERKARQEAGADDLADDPEQQALDFYQEQLGTIATLPGAGGGRYSEHRDAIMCAAAVVNAGYVTEAAIYSDVRKYTKRPRAEVDRSIAGALALADPWRPRLRSRYRSNSSTQEPVAQLPKPKKKKSWKGKRTRIEAAIAGQDDQPQLAPQPRRYLDPINPAQGHRLTCIKAPLGAGKTTAAAEYMQRFDSVLVLSPRIALSAALSGNLNFLNYQDETGAIIARHVVCTIDSIGRCQRRYSLIVIDEIEQVLEALTAPKSGQKTPPFQMWLDLRSKLQAADEVLVMDAHLSRHSIKTLQRMMGITGADTRMIGFDHCEPEITDRFYPSREGFELEITRLCKAGKTLAIPCNTKTAAERMEKLCRKAGAASVLVHHRDQTDAAKDALQDVNASWSQYQVVIYSPTVQSGVSFDIPDYFDHVCLCATRPPRDPVTWTDLDQMLARVRHPRSKTRLIYLQHGTEKESERRRVTRDELRERALAREIGTQAILLREGWTQENQRTVQPYDADMFECWLDIMECLEGRRANIGADFIAECVRRGHRLELASDCSKQDKAKQIEIGKATDQHVRRETAERIAATPILNELQLEGLEALTTPTREERDTIRHNQLRRLLGRSEVGLIERTLDPNDRLDRKVRQLGNALLWAHGYRDLALSLDADDYNRGYTIACQGRSSRAEATADALRIVAEHVHPELRPLLEPDLISSVRYYSEESLDQQWANQRAINANGHVAERLCELLDRPGALEALKARGLSPDKTNNSQVGALLKSFGIERKSERPRINGKLTYLYKIDLDELRELLPLVQHYYQRQRLKVLDVRQEREYLESLCVEAEPPAPSAPLEPNQLPLPAAQNSPPPLNTSGKTLIERVRDLYFRLDDQGTPYEIVFQRLQDFAVSIGLPDWSGGLEELLFAGLEDHLPVVCD